ncbi:MAG: Xaa-Pro dipeptidyl-peptidase [Fimbriimonadaceae bacterium]
MFRTRPLLLLAFAGLSIHALAQSAQPVFVDGQAQVVEAFSDSKLWVRERLWVETTFDSDKDGKLDRMHVDVTRQWQTQSEGLKVPVIYESSPFFAGTAGGRSILWDVKHELGEDPPPRTHPEVAFQPDRTFVSNALVTVWVPRGFAVVHSEAPGTGLSTGSPTVGGDAERFAPKAVIDWLNGRAKGYTTIDGSVEVRATWCTGKVGMTGTSYNGTIPVAAATTGVEGLEAIIPVAPNTSYYHYYRSNGLVRHPGGWLGEDIDSLYDFINSGNPAGRARSNELYRDGLFVQHRERRTGDYNQFWAERDLLPYAKNIKCAVLMAHAFNDWNVVPEHSVRISNAVRGRVPLVQYFHQGGHGGNPPMELMNKWFTRFLYGVKNGVEDGPKAYIVREGSRTPTEYADYPHPDAEMVTLYPGADGDGIGSLSVFATMGLWRPMTIVDDVSFDAPTLVKAAESLNRLLYATPELKAPLHISGTCRITVKLASSKPAANLSVYLVQLPWEDGRIGTSNLITRGWADPQNAASLKNGGNYDSMSRGTSLVPGEFVTLTFDLQPDDQVIPAGKKIALMIMSSDKDFTLWPTAGTKLTFDLNATRIEIPVVGGAQALMKAVSVS